MHKHLAHRAAKQQRSKAATQHTLKKIEPSYDQKHLLRRHKRKHLSKRDEHKNQQLWAEKKMVM